MHVGAVRYERSDARTTQRNGARERVVSTGSGDLSVRIPKMRTGSFFPSLLDPRRRIDVALHAVVMDAYVHGVSSRKVDGLVAALGVESGIWPAFTGVLVRDGYSGYTHLTGALHAWCGAHLLRDLRSIHDGDPGGQVWADAMATTLLDAHHAARAAREAGQNALDPAVLARIRNHYLGALARGDTDNHGKHGPLATDARTLIRRLRRYEDMILRFAADLAVPFSNNVAERDARPVKVQQRTSGGCWRTLQGLADFAVVQSCLSTATKWGLDTLDVLVQLFTTGAWLPPAAQPA